jgi:hypothetical protein
MAADAEDPSGHARDGAPMTPPPARRRVRRTLLLVALALVAAAAGVFASHPWWLAKWLGSYLSERSGREVHFDKVRLGLGDGLAPEAVFDGVRIADAPWTGASRPFAVLGQAVFRFAWHRFEDRWVVTRMILRDGEVHLVRQADGRRNWRLRDPEDRGPGHFWFQALEPHRVALGFRHDAAELDLLASATELQPGDPSSGDAAGLVTRVDFDIRWRGVAFTGRADTGPEITFFETGRWFPLRGHVEVPGVRIEADGRAADLFRRLRIDAATAASGTTLSGFRPIIGARGVEPRPFRAATRLVVDDAVYRFEAARVKVGSTDLAGDLAWSRKGERPALSATLASDSADLADLMWLVGKGQSSAPPRVAAARAASASASTPASAASAAARGPYDGARELDAEIAFQAKRFRVATVPLLQSLALKAKLGDGLLAIRDVDLGWGGGHSTGTVGVDLRQKPPRAEAELETRGVRIETLLPTSDEKRRITGALRARASLKAAGDDLESLRASLAGKVTATLSGGTIPSLLDAQMGLEIGKVMRTFLTGSSALPLHCAAATAELGGGLARITSLVIDSANTRTTGVGVVDLRHGVIDIKLTPEPKRPGLLELKNSIRLSGRPPNLEKELVERLPPVKAAGCDAGKP